MSRCRDDLYDDDKCDKITSKRVTSKFLCVTKYMQTKNKLGTKTEYLASCENYCYLTSTFYIII